MSAVLIEEVADFPLSQCYQDMLKAMVAMWRVMRDEQVKNTLIAGMSSKTKADGTNSVASDKKSERAARECLKGYPVHGEELGVTRVHPQYLIWVDPNDGTRPFFNGMSTSTGIVALYDKLAKKAIACIVAEWSTGRVWMYTPEMESTEVFYIEDGGKGFSEHRTVHVHNGPLSPEVSVFIDNFPNFKLKGSNSLNHTELKTVYCYLFGDFCQVMHEGTNAGHHVFVAQGGDGHSVSGAITLCRGGPWDVAPALLVAKAGGVVRGFKRDEGSSLFVEVAPLAFEDHHFTVSANDEATASVLTQALTAGQLS